MIYLCQLVIYCQGPQPKGSRTSNWSWYVFFYAHLNQKLAILNLLYNLHHKLFEWRFCWFIVYFSLFVKFCSIKIRLFLLEFVFILDFLLLRKEHFKTSLLCDQKVKVTYLKKEFCVYSVRCVKVLKLCIMLNPTHWLIGK